MKRTFFVLKLLIVLGIYKTFGQQSYINPLNLDYTYMIYNAHENISYRSGADPAVVSFKGEYYMFVTRSMGYWHSKDLTNWSFISPEKWYFEGSNAPAAFNYKDSVLYVTGNPSGHMSVLYTDNPKKGDWKAVPAILNDLQDPALFIDDDGQAYVFWGSSNTYPIRAKKLDKNLRFKPSKETYELFGLDGSKHGWERFGENHSDTTLSGYIEGPWMTKHDNKYYIQYAAPGTEFNVYGDGVYTSDNPLGPYQYAPNNPFAYKPGGYANGAGHGSTVLDSKNQYWHFGSISISSNVGWERRIAMFPTYFDKDGLMHTDTYFGDYPRYAPITPDKAGQFRGWMLLSYQKPVTASSFVQEYCPENVTDENIKSFWLSETNSSAEWMEIDLMHTSDVHAIQVNYHDYKSNLFGRIDSLYHRYLIESSINGKTWTVIVDKTKSFDDVPNDYVDLITPRKARYIRFKNIHVPTPHLAISDLRVFGIGNQKVSKEVKNFSVKRQPDRRDAKISWEADKTAQGYNVIWGISPDKLYSSWLVYKENTLDLKSLSVDQEYYFTIESFNENGVSKRSPLVKVQ